MHSSTALRRRLPHANVDGTKQEHLNAMSMDSSLSEPLLRDDIDYGDRQLQEYAIRDLLDDERTKINLHWSLIFSQLLSHWTQWLASLMVGSRSFLGRVLMIPSTSQKKMLALTLTPLQEERLTELQRRLRVPFDGSLIKHQDALKQLWRLAYPNREIPPLKSELWKEMGWQGIDPSTDFRGGGFIALENLIYFAEKYPESFQSLLLKRDGQRAEWEYPFAIAGINISFMLAQMLGLHSGKPNSKAGVGFLKLLAEDEMAFDELYCIAFQLMDAQWLAKRASYMEFNEVLKCTKAQLERDLELDQIQSIKDLPAHGLLRRWLFQKSYYVVVTQFSTLSCK